LHGALSAADAERRRQLGRMKSVAVDHDSGLTHGADEGAPAAPIGFGLRGILSLGTLGGALVEQHHELHGLGLSLVRT